MSFVTTNNGPLSLVEFGRDPCQNSLNLWLSNCVPLNSHVPFVAHSLIGPREPYPFLTSNSVFVRHLAEHVPVTSPSGRKCILTLLDLPG
jgi:hypothetical protein